MGLYNFGFVSHTTAEWSVSPTVLAEGQVGVEKTVDGTTLMKVGDGVTVWASLPYVKGATGPTGGPAVVSSEIESESTEDGASSLALNRIVGKIVGQPVEATTEVAGKLRYATDAEAVAGTNVLAAVTPNQLVNVKTVLEEATETVKGVGLFATVSDVQGGFDTKKVLTPELLSKYGGTAPIGRIVQYSGDVVPTGWLYCNGGLLDKASYGGLYSVIGDKYNVGAVASDKFMLPKIDSVDLGFGNWEDTGGSDYWTMSVAVNQINGDVWCGDNSGEVKVLRGGTGSWQSTGSGEGSWRSLAIHNATGDVWAGTHKNGHVMVFRQSTQKWEDMGGDFYQKGAIIDINQNTGDVWVAHQVDGVHVLRSGSTNWVNIGGLTMAGAYAIKVNSITGDVFSLIYLTNSTANSGVYVLRGGAGSWQNTNFPILPSINPVCMQIDRTNGDVYAAPNGGDIKVLKGGSGSWQNTSSGGFYWRGIAINYTTHDLWACAELNSVYVCRAKKNIWESAGIENSAYWGIDINYSNGSVWVSCHDRNRPNDGVKKYTPATITNIIKAA